MVQVASQQPVYLGRHLPAMIEGCTTPTFRCHDYASLVALGRFGVFGMRFLNGPSTSYGHALPYRRYQRRLIGPRQAGAWTITFVEEILRLESPVQSSFREVKQDTEVNGTFLPKGPSFFCAMARPIAIRVGSRAPSRWMSVAPTSGTILPSAMARMFAPAGFSHVKRRF